MSNQKPSLSERLAARGEGLHRRTAPDGGEVYSGPLARRALRAVGARAMTMDHSIFVDEGFDLEDPEDRALYAHERHHQMESGGTDDHGPRDAEEVAARAIERMVLHRSKQGDDFGEILRDVKQDGVAAARAFDEGGGEQQPGPREGDPLKAAYAALRASGKSHETVVRELVQHVLHTLEHMKESQLIRASRARTI